jgi:galactoside O-acetyltransferase
MKKLNAGFFDENDLLSMGIKRVGHNVKISKVATVIGLEDIEIGNNVRIDDFTIIIASGGWVNIGSFVHIAAHCVISGSNGITLEDFSGLSHGVKIYSASDDYTGVSMTNPLVPEKYKKTIKGAVNIGRHAIVGSGSVVLPNTEINEGCSIGALSLVKGRLQSWSVYSGCPVKRLKSRPKEILDLEEQLKSDLGFEENYE